METSKVDLHCSSMLSTVVACGWLKAVGRFRIDLGKFLSLGPCDKISPRLVNIDQQMVVHVRRKELRNV